MMLMALEENYTITIVIDVNRYRLLNQTHTKVSNPTLLKNAILSFCD